MKSRTVQAALVGVALLLTAVLTKAITPTIKLSDSRPPLTLSEVVPEKFGEWQEDKAQVAAVVNPETQQAINKIYAQTLSRTYVNKDGKHIMLSIAYGNSQSDDLAVHFPEGCYGGQGFAVGPTTFHQMSTPAGDFSVAHMLASTTNRIEPVTYWIMVGERAVDTSWALKKARLAYALKRTIPDATLIRVSNITADIDDGYQLQQEFIRAMLVAMPPAYRTHFANNTR